MKKLLIVYYSWANGNTERVAKKLQSIAGGEFLRIDTAVPYSGSYDDVVEQVKFDSNGGDRLETPESKIEAWAQSVKALL